jgi:hypothetical protein
LSHAYASKAGRLGKEVERCFRKWCLQRPKAAAPGEEPEWPDLTKGEPKRTYRNARAAIMALGIACSYDGGDPCQQFQGD